MTTHLTFIHARSALHAGTGQGVDLIDLPIARERATNLPFLPGSSLKGALRDLVKEQSLREAIFGPEKTNADAFAGSVQFSDQRLLLLPIRSMAGTFAWVTCPFVLARLRRDARDAGVADTTLPALPVVDRQGDALVASGSKLIVGTQIVLEDLDLTPKIDDITSTWAIWIGKQVFEADWQTMLTARICIVHDDVFGFLAETATEVSARIALQADIKTVTGGALWYEEALPAESLLYGMVIAEFSTKAREKLNGIGETGALQKLREQLAKPIQLGGKATTGKGICSVTLTGGHSTVQEGS